MIRLQPAKEFTLPVVAECVSPDAFEGKEVEEINGLPIWEGNKQKKLGDLFKVEEAKDENSLQGLVITINGNISKVRSVGSHMKKGEITINGDTGMHLGQEMRGGTITVHGNVDAWAGSMMKGGTIEIHGNAGDYAGAPYRGSTKGMSGGKITVYGDVGHEVGAYMKKATIRVYGSAGQFVGLRMREGAIYVKGDCGERAGACMIGGRIIVGGKLRSVLPSFTVDGIRSKAKIEDDETVEGPFYVFQGDLTEDGKGKLYVSKPKNPHLNSYERFL